MDSRRTAKPDALGRGKRLIAPEKFREGARTAWYDPAILRSTLGHGVCIASDRP